MTTVNIPQAIVNADPKLLKEAEDRLVEASVWLMRNEPFYSALFMGLDRVPIQGTMGVTKGKLFFDPEFVIECSPGKLNFIVMHEILHLVFGHWMRGKTTRWDHKTFNDAADYVINNIIVKAGQDRFGGYVSKHTQATRDWQSYQMPEDGLYDSKYDKMTTEDVADLLKKNNPTPPPEGDGNEEGDGDGKGSGEGKQSSNGKGSGEGKQSSNGTGKWGEVFEAVNEDGSSMSSEELAEAQAEMSREIMQANQVAKARGEGSVGVHQLIEELYSPSEDWADVLRDMLTDNLPKDITFEQRNRMFMGSDIVMPTVEKEGLGHVAIYCDDSGSVSDREMAQFATDVQFIFDELKPEKVSIIHFDTRGAGIIEVEQGDDLELKRILHGGTDFRAPFLKAQQEGIEHDIDVAIVLTDGGDYNFPEEPPYDVIWGTTGAFMMGDPPFGQILALKFQHDQRWSWGK